MTPSRPPSRCLHSAINQDLSAPRQCALAIEGRTLCHWLLSCRASGTWPPYVADHGASGEGGTGRGLALPGCTATRTSCGACWRFGTRRAMSAKPCTAGDGLRNSRAEDCQSAGYRFEPSQGYCCGRRLPVGASHCDRSSRLAGSFMPPEVSAQATA